MIAGTAGAMEALVWAYAKGRPVRSRRDRTAGGVRGGHKRRAEGAVASGGRAAIDGIPRHRRTPVTMNRSVLARPRPMICFFNSSIAWWSLFFIMPNSISIELMHHDQQLQFGRSPSAIGLNILNTDSTIGWVLFGNRSWTSLRLVAPDHRTAERWRRSSGQREGQAG
jgi:hypothetical protein